MAKLPMRVNVSARTVSKNLKEAEELQQNIVQRREEGVFVEVPINDIKEPAFHDRRYIEKSSILELSKSIDAIGLLYPIVVRKLANGDLERIIGYRRIEAMKILGKDKIQAIILENISDSQASLIMTTENLQREDLSIYDSTLAIIDYLSLTIGVTQEKCISLLNRFKNFTTNQVKRLDEQDHAMYEQVEEALRKTGKIGISGLINRLSMLNMHPLIKEALSSGELAFTNAQIINKLKDDEQVKITIQEVLEKKLSKRETAAFVDKILAESNKAKHSTDQLNIDIKNINLKNIKRLAPDKQEKAVELIQELLKIIDTK
jgi:ParB family chromosome partitioning protein